MNHFTDLVQFLGQLITGFRYRHEAWIASLRKRDIHDCRLTSPSIILDLANGRLRPQYTLLKAQGYPRVGIDLANKRLGLWEESAYRFARWYFACQSGTSLSGPKDLWLTQGDVCRLPFGPRSFDLITSVAAFEHFLHVPLVLQECSRVLKPGSVLWVMVHPFTALSGGHNVKLMEIPLRNLPRGVDPWDHLRKRCLPFHVPLNEWRIHQYLEAFAQHFEIVKHYCAMREGEHLLSKEVLDNLPGYSADELTCGSYVIVARKPRV
jgi:SAM-dependent methyltransferase